MGLLHAAHPFCLPGFQGYGYLFLLHTHTHTHGYFPGIASGVYFDGIRLMWNWQNGVSVSLFLFLPASNTSVSMIFQEQARRCTGAGLHTPPSSRNTEVKA